MTQPSDSLSFAPLKRLNDQLEAAGMDEQNIAVILGRVTALSQEVAELIIAKELGEAEFKRLNDAGTEEEKITALLQAYEEKTGKSGTMLLNESLEKVVQDFEQS